MMSSAGTTKNPRRQPTTYGKASQRTIRALEIPPLSGNGANGIGGVNLKSKNIGDGSKITGQIRQGGTSYSSVPYSQIQSEENRGDDLSSPGSTATESAPSVYKNVIFDISSDDELLAPLDLRIGSRKRRKLDNTGVEDTAHAGWDDASLQEHLAAEMGEPFPRVVKLLDYSKAIRAGSSKVRSMGHARSPGRHREKYAVDSGQATRVVPGNITIHSATLSKSRIIQQQPPLQHQAEPPARSDRAKLQSHVKAKQPRLSGPARLKQPVTPPSEMVLSTTEGKELFNPPGGEISFTKVSKITTKAHTHALVDGNPFQRSEQLLTPDRQLPDSKPEQNCLVAIKTGRDPQVKHMITPRTKLKDRLRGWNNSPKVSDEEDEDEEEEEDDHDENESRTRTSSSDQILGDQRVQRTTAIFSSKLPQIQSQKPIPLGPPLHTSGPKFTYSRQRSYLTEEDVEEALLLSMPVSRPENRQSRPRKEEARRRPHETQLLDDLETEKEDTAGPQSLAMQSIHELRQAGGNARVMGDVEAVLDEIDPSNSVPAALKRGGLLDISKKMQQPEFCRQFLDHGLETRLVAQIGVNTDDVANILILAGIVQLLAYSNSPHLLLQLVDPRLIEFLGQQIDKSDDLAAMVQLRKVNMSKALQMDMRSFCSAFVTSNVWRNGRPSQITGRVLSLQCLEFLVRYAREGESTNDILPRKTIDKLVDLLAAGRDSSTWLLDESNVAEMRLVLSILESVTITQPVSSDRDDFLWRVEYVPKLEEFLTMVQNFPGESCGDLLSLALRLCLNVTNNNPVLCEGFSSLAFIDLSVALIANGFHRLSDEAEVASQALVLDDMVLSIGLLINLTEWSENIRKLFVARREAQPTALETLSRLFQANLARTSEATSEEETLLNVPFGYLSVLLCFLSISKSVRRQVCSHLQGDKLDQLLGAADEFLHYHQQILEDVQLSEQSGDLKVSFVHRLQSVVDRLRCEEA